MLTLVMLSLKEAWHGFGIWNIIDNIYIGKGGNLMGVKQHNYLDKGVG